MDDLRSMAVFAAVIEHGSMNAAARQLEMSPSAVSQHIKKLEQQHGVALLHRTTRKLTLTEAGAIFCECCNDMLYAARRGNMALAAMHDAPSGELRITAPSGFAGGILAHALAPLLAANPELSLQLFFEDDIVDLTAQRIDLALQAWEMPPHSRQVARHLADWRMLLCASPSYLAQHPPLVAPQDLLKQVWIAQNTPGSDERLELQRKGEIVRIKPQVRIGSNSMLSSRAFALEGMGVALQPEPEIRRELAAGTLVQVLPEWQLPGCPIFLVTPRRDAQPAKVRHAIAALQQALGGAVESPTMPG